jgi:soluble lytic murein transglycosylase
MRDRRASLALGLAAALAGCIAQVPVPPGDRGAGMGAGRGTPPAIQRPARPVLQTSGPADLGDLALLWEARDAQAAGDPSTVRRAASSLGARYPDSVWAGETYLLAGLAARRQGDLSEAGRWLAEALPLLDDTGPAWRRAVVVLAETTARSGDDATALRLARTLREKHPRGLADRRARRLTDRILARRPDLAGDVEQQLAEASLRLREGDAAWAFAAAERLAAGGGRDGVRALLVRAHAERALGRTRDAEATCKFVSQIADADLAAEALVAAARWRWNADDDAAAKLFFERAVRRAPDSAPALDATYALTRIAQEAQRWDEAARGYARVAEAGDPALARAGRWGVAWVRYLAGDWAAAAGAVNALAARDDADALAGRYWEARALERTGDPRGRAALRALAEEEPDTYYGWMAGRRLGAAPAPVESVTPPPPPAFPAALTGVHARRARALLALGLPRLARREVDALRGSAEPALVVQAYEAVGAPEAAIRVAATMPRTDESRRALYPLGYWQVVREAAAREGLDPLLVQALIRQESAFAARAVSPADAYGLMQLLPGTAADVAAARGEPPPDRVRLTEVQVNVALGTALLRRLLAQYAGSEIKALAAYNAGEDAVRKWESRYGQRDEDEFVELISFRETKRYVKVVLENYQVYRALYADSDVATSRGKPPKAPFDMMTMTSPASAEPTR